MLCRMTSLPTRVEYEVAVEIKDLAYAEHRSFANMVAVLLREALAARKEKV